MTNKSPQNNRRIATPIIIAIITLVGVCITTLGGIIVGIFPGVLDLFDPNPNKVEAITFRVTEISGISVPHAKVILLSGNDIHIQYTDSNGGSTFSLIKSETLRVFVETDQYEIYDQIFSANESNPIEIRLNPKDVSRKSVIIRVIDDKDDIPINGAEVILIANSNIYSQITDSNGITKFTTAFPTDEIDGDISVSVSGFKAEHQRVTLEADRVQDIRLDKSSGTLIIGFTGEGKEAAKTPEASNESANHDGGNETGNPDNINEYLFDCSSKFLSPEETINCGTFEYKYTIDVTQGGCTINAGGNSQLHHYEGVEILSTTFSTDATKMSIEPLGPQIYRMIDANIYQSNLADEGSSEDTIMFNENGFERRVVGFNVNGEFDCELYFVYTITK